MTVHQIHSSYAHPVPRVVCTCGESISAESGRDLDRAFKEHRTNAMAGDQQAGLGRARAALADAIARKETPA